MPSIDIDLINLLALLHYTYFSPLNEKKDEVDIYILFFYWFVLFSFHPFKTNEKKILFGNQVIKLKIKDESSLSKRHFTN